MPRGMSKAIAVVNSEYRNLPLSQLQESPTNPRRRFDERALEELAASVRSQGVLQPLLVRPLEGTPTRLLDANFKSILFAHIYLNIKWLPFFNVGNVKVSV